MKEKAYLIIINFLFGIPMSAFFTKLIFPFVLIIIFFCACSQSSNNNEDLVEEQTILNTATVTPLPLPIKAKYIDLDSVIPPVIVPLKRTPQMIPAHPNVHRVGKTTSILVPKKLKVITLGKQGIPLPTILHAKRKVVTAWLLLSSQRI